MAVVAPKPVTQQAPAAAANLPASTVLIPRSNPVNKPQKKQSPAPVVSIT